MSRRRHNGLHARSSPQGQVLFGTNAAEILLNGASQVFVAFGRDKQGRVFLKPIEVPEGTFSVSVLQADISGQRRISAKALKLPAGQNFIGTWDDPAETMYLNAVPESHPSVLQVRQADSDPARTTAPLP